MKDYFHEAHVAMNLAQLEYATTNSLSALGAHSTNHICEIAVREIWEKATGDIFPHDYFKPFHKPVVYIKRMGLWPYYSPQTQGFMGKQHGMALDEVRYENTQAYRDHTNPKSRMRGKELIAGTLAVLEETEKFATMAPSLNAFVSTQARSEGMTHDGGNCVEFSPVSAGWLPPCLHPCPGLVEANPRFRVSLAQRKS